MAARGWNEMVAREAFELNSALDSDVPVSLRPLSGAAAPLGSVAMSQENRDPSHVAKAPSHVQST